MPTFLDPRTNPDPTAPRPPARFTSDPDALDELHRLCRDGRLYDVERWIRDGRPLQLAAGAPNGRRRVVQTALGIALERQDHSLVLLLVANGYDWSEEPIPPLDTALRLRRQDLVDLFLAWGADPRQVSLDALCDTYDSPLYESFRSLGVDFTSGHALAYALAYHTSNKPLFGFARRHRLEDPKFQAELDIALAYHAWEGNEKGVMLCLWAGANPHSPVPDLRWDLGDHEDEDDDRYSAVHAACSGGHAAILERLRPDPSLDDYEELYCRAPNPAILEILARSALPKSSSRVVATQIARAACRFASGQPVETLEALFAAGARWDSSPGDEIQDARRHLLKTDDWTFVRLMKLLAMGDHCSPAVLTELARSPSLRKRMRQVGLIPPDRRHRSELDRSHPTRDTAALARCGIELPKEKKAEARLPPTVRIGGRSRDGHDLRLDRPGLFERVWSTPVETLAKEWGLSGRGLAKACRRLRIPVPPRGHWARVAAGQRTRRPSLPALPTGQGEEIVVHVPAPAVTGRASIRTTELE
jgi:hypothetical protein